MPYRDGKYVHPDQLPKNERDEWYEQHPHPSSWSYVQKEKQKANREEAKRIREAEEGIEDE
jgi:hypothetical protein